MKSTLVTTIILGFATLSGSAVRGEVDKPEFRYVYYVDAGRCDIPFSNDDGIQQYIQAARDQETELGCGPQSCSCLNQSPSVLSECVEKGKTLCSNNGGEWHQNPFIP